VTLKFRGALEPGQPRTTRIPFWRIKRPTRRWPSRRPCSFSSPVMRGLPWLPEARAVLVAHMGQDHQVVPLSLQWRPVPPGPQPTIRYAPQAAQPTARKAAAIAGNEREPHGF
jgi:hypothetical protein